MEMVPGSGGALEVVETGAHYRRCRLAEASAQGVEDGARALQRAFHAARVSRIVSTLIGASALGAATDDSVRVPTPTVIRAEAGQR